MKRPLSYDRTAKATAVALLLSLQPSSTNALSIANARELQRNFEVPSSCEIFDNQFFWTTHTEMPSVKGSSLTFTECYNFCAAEKCEYFTFSNTEPGHCELWLVPKDPNDLQVGQNTLANLFSTYECGLAAAATSAPTTTAPTGSTPAPTPATLAPTVSTSAPTISTSVPTVSTTAPSVSTSAPTVSTPVPTQSTGAPTPGTRAPTGSTLSPTLSTPSPTTGAPTGTMSPTGTASPTTEVEALGKTAGATGMPDEVMFAMAGAGAFLFIFGIVIGLFLRRRGRRSRGNNEQTMSMSVYPGQDMGGGTNSYGSGSNAVSGGYEPTIQPPPGLFGSSLPGSGFGSAQGPTAPQSRNGMQGSPIVPGSSLRRSGPQLQKATPPPVPARGKRPGPPLPARAVKQPPPPGLPQRNATAGVAGGRLSPPPLPSREVTQTLFYGGVTPKSVQSSQGPRAYGHTLQRQPDDDEDESLDGFAHPGGRYTGDFEFDLPKF